MLRIINGEVYDPINGINGQVKDIWVRGDKIVTGFQNTDQPQMVIDAAGMVVMPGGIDIHSHIAGPKVNVGRTLRPEDHRREVVARTRVTRSGVGETVPSTFITGYKYARMGYTTVMEAAAPPLKVRHVHEEFSDLPMIDKGLFTLMGNNHFIMEFIKKGEREKLTNYVAWLLASTKAFAIKVVNPGGVESWKQGQEISGLDELVQGYGVTPRQIITNLVEVNEEIGLPHPVHLHCNNIGQAGNYQTTLETLRSVEGQRIHLTHLQFHSYGGQSKKELCSKAEEIAAYINDHPKVTVDVGQVIFGPATTMTADSPLQWHLHKLTGNKWCNSDVELETGSGVVPLTFREQSLANSIQWAVGMELFLLIENPWQVFLTTDHPNAGPFTAYPKVIRLLMDRDYREEVFASLHPSTASRTWVKELRREYTLQDIVIITRAGPAKALGLTNKGHLGIGADADLAIYPKKENKEEMFSSPAYVIKDGKPVVNQGKIVAQTFGKTLFVEPYFEPWIEKEISCEFAGLYSVSLANYPVELEYLQQYEVIPCRSTV